MQRDCVIRTSDELRLTAFLPFSIPIVSDQIAKIPQEFNIPNLNISIFLSNFFQIFINNILKNFYITYTFLEFFLLNVW